MPLPALTRCIGLALATLAALVATEYHGQVKFAGLPMPGVTITATQHDKTIPAATDPQGIYSFADLPDGNWSLQATKPGFTPIQQDVTTGTNLPGASFEMQMLPLAEMRAAPTSAPPSSQTTPYQSTDLTASANAPPPAPEQAPPITPEVTAELTQRAADGFLINGSAINGRSTPFAQSPAFGNARRGGPRQYTYALALVDSNSILNAANYSLTGQQTLKPPFNNMTGTFSFGGPVKIPRLLPRNGPQFTVNYSRVENRNSRVQTSLMPDAAERTGDFSQILNQGKPVTITDPTNGQPFANNIIPASRISPQAISLLRFYPAPNFNNTGTYNYQVPLIGNTHTDNLRASLSKTVKRKNQISGLLGLQDTRGDNNNQFNFLDLNRALGINSTASWRRTYTARFFGTLTYQFSRQSNELLPFFANRENISATAGIAGNNQQPLNWGPPALQFNQTTIAGLNDGTASTIHNQTNAIAYAAAWNHHTHNINFGGDFRWQQFNTISQSNPRGMFTFNGAATGLDFADALLGIPDASAIAFGNADKYLRQSQPDLYFQDDWKARSGLTFTLGLRWEYASPLTEKYGRLVNLDIAPGFTAVTPKLGDTIRPDYHEFQPKIALAWRPFSASSMVIRAGYGISHNTQVYQPFANLMSQQSPLSTSLNIANTVANPLTLANGFYAPPNITTNTVAIDPNFKIGYAQIWDFIIQRDLPGALQMVATYTGTKGTHQLQAFAPNTYPTGAVQPSGYVYYTSGGNSTRESGTLQLRRRLHNGLTATTQYTYSKSIDDAATLGGGTLGSVAQNWQDLTAERGLSTFDQRRAATIQLQYTSGIGVGAFGSRIVRDWTFVNAINLGSGLPLTPIYSLLCPGTGIQCNERASYSGGAIYGTPAAGQWGNAGRDSITGPGQFSMSASLARAFRLTDRFTLNLRLDANNPLNHVVVTQLNTTVTNPLFLQPQQVNAMRTVTTTLRLTF